jgi:hypothetical protein
MGRLAPNGGQTVGSREHRNPKGRGAVDLEGHLMTIKVAVSVNVDVAAILRWGTALVYLLT